MKCDVTQWNDFDVLIKSENGKYSLIFERTDEISTDVFKIATCNLIHRKEEPFYMMVSSKPKISNFSATDIEESGKTEYEFIKSIIQDIINETRGCNVGSVTIIYRYGVPIDIIYAKYGLGAGCYKPTSTFRINTYIAERYDINFIPIHFNEQVVSKAISDTLLEVLQEYLSDYLIISKYHIYPVVTQLTTGGRGIAASKYVCVLPMYIIEKIIRDHGSIAVMMAEIESKWRIKLEELARTEPYVDNDLLSTIIALDFWIDSDDGYPDKTKRQDAQHLHCFKEFRKPKGE